MIFAAQADATGKQEGGRRQHGNQDAGEPTQLLQYRGLNLSGGAAGYEADQVDNDTGDWHLVVWKVDQDCSMCQTCLPANQP